MCRTGPRSGIFASVTTSFFGFPRLFGLGIASLAFGLSLARPASAAEPDAASEDTSVEEGATDAAGQESDSEDEAKAKDASKDAEDAKSDAKSEDADEAFGHMGQLGLRAGLVLGYRMVLRYDSSPYCAAPDVLKAPNDQRKFCGHGAPLAADFGLSFGLLDFFEPFVWARFGFGAEEQTDTKPIVVVGAGARLYTMSDAAFKIFVEPAVALEFESGRGSPAWQANSPEYKQDLVFHLAAGPQLDFLRNFGAYATAGVTTGVIRAIHTSLDLQIGVQGRYP